MFVCVFSPNAIPRINCMVHFVGATVLSGTGAFDKHIYIYNRLVLTCDKVAPVDTLDSPTVWHINKIHIEYILSRRVVPICDLFVRYGPEEYHPLLLFCCSCCLLVVGCCCVRNIRSNERQWHINQVCKATIFCIVLKELKYQKTKTKEESVGFFFFGVEEFVYKSITLVKRMR